jgi:hypothetical protein
VLRSFASILSFRDNARADGAAFFRIHCISFRDNARADGAARTSLKFRLCTRSIFPISCSPCHCLRPGIRTLIETASTHVQISL